MKNLKMLIIILIIFAIGMSIALIALHAESKKINNELKNSNNNTIENTTQGEYIDEVYTKQYKETQMKDSVKGFIELINEKKYSEAYNLLSPEFKKENFPTEQDFTQNIKTNWFENNIISSREITEIGTVLVNLRESLSTKSKRMQKEFRVLFDTNNNFTIEFNM